MRKMKNYRIAGMALLMGVVFTSCLDDSDPQFDIMGDVIVTKKKVNNEVQYAPSYFVYGNLGMKSATVTLPNDGGTVNLDGTIGSLTYSKEPTEEDYSVNIPEEGNYLFEAVSSKDEMLQVSDQLQVDDLAIPEFDSLKFISNSTLKVSWDAVSGADGYYINILDSDGEDVFISYTLEKDVTEYTISESDTSGKWQQTAATGQTYTIQINAFSYDADATANYYGYNIQEVSIGETQLDWE